MSYSKTKNEILTLENIAESELFALAQFAKRVGWREFSRCAASEEEAHAIRSAFGKLQRALDHAGYAPR